MRRSWLGRSFGLLLRIVVVIVLVGIPALLYYLHTYGFTGLFRTQIEEALSSPAAAVTVDRVTFSVFDGIVAQGVKVLGRAQGDREVVSIRKAVLALNFSALLEKRIEVDSLRLMDGRLAVQFASDGVDPDEVVLTGINAVVSTAAGEVNIRDAEFLLGKLRVIVDGKLETSGQIVGSSSSGPASPEVVETIRRYLRIFNEIDLGGQQAELKLRITGDLADPETLRSPAFSLEATDLKWRAYSLDVVDLEGSYDGEMVSLDRITIEGESGSFDGYARWNRKSSTITGEGNGTVAASTIAQLVANQKWAKDLQVKGGQEFTAKVQSGAGAIKVTGHVEAGAFSYRGIQVSSATSLFAWDGKQVAVRDAEIRSDSGTIGATALLAPGNVKVRLSIHANPREFLPVLGPKERELIETMEFKDIPKVSIAMAGPKLEFKAMEGEGTIELGRTAMRGYWIDSAKSRLVIADQAVEYQDFVITRGSDKGTGTFTYDFGRREVRMDNVRSSLDPEGVLMWIDPRIAKTVSVYRFHSNPDVTVDGLVHMGDPEKNDLDIAVEAPDGLTYELIGRDLSFGSTSAKVGVKGQSIRAFVDRTEIYGGTANIQAVVSTNPTKPTFSVDARVAGIDFPSITKLYFGYDKSLGRMSGQYSFTAHLRESNSMRGSGSIRVEEGHVLAIPVLGPLSEVISSVIPGAGHDPARLATADFTVADGRIATEDLSIAGGGFEMFGNGWVAFNGQMNMTMRINARGIPGVVLFPVSKLFEYQSTGTMADPDWKPKVVPKEVWGVVDTVGSTVGSAVDGASNAVGGALDAVGGVMEDAASAIVGGTPRDREKQDE